MKMMFLLVSTVVVLVSPAVASPTLHKPEDNLNDIFDLAVKYNESLTKQFFVEDVSHLVEDGCEDKFFCKVSNILHKHEHFGKKEDEMAIVRHLNVFINGRNANCTELLNNVTSTGTTRPITKMMEYLTTCIQQRNLSLVKKSDA